MAVSFYMCMLWPFHQPWPLCRWSQLWQNRRRTVLDEVHVLWQWCNCPPMQPPIIRNKIKNNKKEKAISCTTHSLSSSYEYSFASTRLARVYSYMAALDFTIRAIKEWYRDAWSRCYHTAVTTPQFNGLIDVAHSNSTDVNPLGMVSFISSLLISDESGFLFVPLGSDTTPIRLSLTKVNKPAVPVSCNEKEFSGLRRFPGLCLPSWRKLERSPFCVTVGCKSGLSQHFKEHRS